MRLISRIDIKNDYVVKGICFEGLRKLEIQKPYAKVL